MRRFLLSVAIFCAGCKSEKNFPEGGFDYPHSVAPQEERLYFYQLKGIANRRDAFRYSNYYLFFQAFDEPNLSIKPQAKETFRLTCSVSSDDETLVISFNKEELVIKRGHIAPLYDRDTSKLTNIENLQLQLLERRFPINTTSSRSTKINLYLDSMVKAYPRLQDELYYQYLYDKAIANTPKKIDYKSERLSLSKNQYNSIIDQINSSGYWTMPYEIECSDIPSDAGGYSLEANTFNKYKVVNSIDCPNNIPKFKKLCQRIIEMAKLDTEINLDRTWNVESIDIN